MKKNIDMKINGIDFGKIKTKHIRQCIEDGIYCAIEPHKANWKHWIIDRIDLLCNEDYKSYYGDDVYLDVKIYHTKTKKHHTFSNGFQYTTNRIVKMSDVIKYSKQIND